MNIINIENCDRNLIDLTDHNVYCDTSFDEENGLYTTTICVASFKGKVDVQHRTYTPETSYFHEVFAPCYRSACKRLGITPRIEE